MEKKTANRATFGSKLGVILATVGCAVGLGNIWRFPYMVGANGGAAFLLVYVICILLLGAPVMITEFFIGRHSKRNAAGAFQVPQTFLTGIKSKQQRLFTGEKLLLFIFQVKHQDSDTGRIIPHSRTADPITAAGYRHFGLIRENGIRMSQKQQSRRRNFRGSCHILSGAQRHGGKREGHQHIQRFIKKAGQSAFGLQPVLNKSGPPLLLTGGGGDTAERHQQLDQLFLYGRIGKNGSGGFRIGSVFYRNISHKRYLPDRINFFSLYSFRNQSARAMKFNCFLMQPNWKYDIMYLIS